MRANACLCNINAHPRACHSCLKQRKHMSLAIPEIFAIFDTQFTFLSVKTKARKNNNMQQQCAIGPKAKHLAGKTFDSLAPHICNLLKYQLTEAINVCRRNMRHAIK